MLKNECFSHFKLLQELRFHHHLRYRFEILCDDNNYLIV